jgi:hypothetical protein
MGNHPDIIKKLKTQYSNRFWEGMKARMEMSYFKYGDVEDAKNTDAIASLYQRLDKYKETGNTEFLMDAANFAMIEFMFPKNSLAHFKATDSDQSPGRTTVYGGINSDPNIRKHVYKNDGD